MSQSSDDAPTGPITGAPARAAVGPSRSTHEAHTVSARRWNVVRDLTAGALVILALFFPWNLYFGFRIPHSSRYLFGLLLSVTLLSLAALAVTYVGPWRLAGARFNPVLAGRLRLALNLPYALLVVAFVVFDAYQTIRSGGTVHVPGGIGPGGWLGITGALLSAQPVMTNAGMADEKRARWLQAAQITGYASMFGAALSAGFNLSWRVRYALQPADGASGFGKQNLAVIGTAVVYGVVALAALLVASRWLLRGTEPYRLATIALGASTLVAGIVVWVLPIGREIDAFHGIAQNTSTAGVGYEGYLAWTAAAAMFVPLTLFRSPKTAPLDKNVLRSAVRKALLLIIVWCLGSVAMRLTDLVVAVVLNYPFSRYDTMTLAAFDLAAAVLALWLRYNIATEVLRPRLLSSLCGFLFTLAVSRIIVGVMLAPRFDTSPEVAAHPVYGNDLAQQITSIFDVALCGLTAAILAAAITIGRLRRVAPAPRHPRPGQHPRSPYSSMDAPTTVLSGPARSPRIFRSSDPGQQARPKIYRRDS